jgi:membrane protease YdiL (CAAX protease family)
MNKDTKKSGKKIFEGADYKTASFLFAVTIILLIWAYFGKRIHFYELFGKADGDSDFAGGVYEFLTAFVLMFGTALIFAKLVFKRPMRDYGFQLGDWRYGLKIICLIGPFILLVMVISSGLPDVQAEYPLSKSSLGNLRLFILLEMCWLVYYLGWEFLFRGVMLFHLEEKFGVVMAILMQTIPSALIHIGKPVGESLLSVPAGLLFGYVAIRTRSIWYPMILHALVGLGIDLFIYLRLT